MQLSLVLPAYNEQDNIERAVRSASAASAALVDSYEVVVVDDGSRDGTASVLERLGPEFGDRLKVLTHAHNLGYGRTLRDGFAAARGTLVFYTDSDNQFDLRELAGFLPLMHDYDAVLGYRLDRQDPKLRKFVSAGFNGLSSILFAMPVRDINCSFKLFRRQVLESLVLESDDFFIDTELVARVHRARWRYTQRGVRHYPRTAGRSTVRPGDVPRTLLSLVRIWFRLRRSPDPTVARA